MNSRSLLTIRDAGGAHGILLSCVFAMVALLTCCALPILPLAVEVFANQPDIEKLAPLLVVLPTLVVAVTSVVAGLIATRADRRKLLAQASVLFAMTAPLPMWLDSFGILLASRAVSGVAMGFMLTTAMALTADYFSGPPLHRWIAFQGALGAAAGVFASAVSGLLAELDWRWAFMPLLSAIPLAIALVMLPPPTAGAVQHVTDAAGPEASVYSQARGCADIFGLTILGALVLFPPAYELGMLLFEKGIRSSALVGLLTAVLATGAICGAAALRWMSGIAWSTKAAISIGVVGLGGIALAQSPDLALMVLSAAAIGIGQGIFVPALSLELLERSSGPARSSLAGAFQTTIYLGLFAGPLLARAIAVTLGSSATAVALYGCASIGIAIVLIGLAAMRRPRAPDTL